jgi:hypothetical protein
MTQTITGILLDIASAHFEETLPKTDWQVEGPVLLESKNDFPRIININPKDAESIDEVKGFSVEVAETNYQEFIFNKKEIV